MKELFKAAGIGQETGTEGLEAKEEGLEAKAEELEVKAKGLGKAALDHLKGIFAAIPKTAKAALAVVLIAAVLAGAVGMNTARSGYRAVLNGICKTVNDRDTELDGIAENLLPGFAEEQYHVIMDTIGEVEAVADAVENLEEDIMEAYLEMEDSFGSDVKVSWKVLEKEKMSDLQIRRAERSYQEFSEVYLQNVGDTLDNYEDISQIADRYDLARADVRTVLDSIDALAEDCEYMDISRGYNLVVEISAEGSRDSYSEEVELSVIRANGEWMLDYSTLGGNLLTEVGEELDSMLWWWF